MTLDREQIRRDAEAMSGHVSLLANGRDVGTFARHCLALLAELEQAEARLELEEEARLARIPMHLRDIREAEARGTE